jgi:hypothetical protein
MVLHKGRGGGGEREGEEGRGRGRLAGQSKFTFVAVGWGGGGGSMENSASLVAISGSNKVEIFRAHPFQWPSKWICPCQNHYVPHNINITRDINSKLIDHDMQF